MRIVIAVLLFQLLCAIGIALSYNQWSPYWHGFAENRTLLHSAAVAEHSRVAADLIKMGMDVNAKDNRNWTPLDYALQKGDADIILLLRDRGGYSEQEEQEKIARLKEKEQRRKAKQQEEQRKAQQQRAEQQRKANQQRKAQRQRQQGKTQPSRKHRNRKAQKQQARIYCYATGRKWITTVKACEKAKREAEKRARKAVAKAEREAEKRARKAATKARIKQVEAASKRQAKNKRRAQQRKDAERNRCRKLRKKYPGRGYKVRDGRCTSR